MVRIRLARAGQRNRPFYHIVVADSQRARDSRFIERIGFYNPALGDEQAAVQHERLAYWKSVGAQVSDRVAQLAKRHAKARQTEQQTAA